MPPLNRPDARVTIEQPTDLVDLVRSCGADRRPMIDYGIAHSGLGHPPPPEHVAITQRGASLDHHKRDLTVTASAGLSFGELQAVLNDAQQFLPIDVDDDLSLGEAIQHNVYGPLRVGYGGWRDRLLGLHCVDGEGRDIHAGGRVVKNVAGYDLSRLLVGSLGEMACVYEVTLRTAALPETAVAVQLDLDDPGRIDRMVTDLLTGDAAPTSLSLELRRGEGELWVGYLGQEATCQNQVDALTSWARPMAGLEPRGTTAHPVTQDHRLRTQRRRWRRQAAALVHVLVPPAQTGRVCRALLEQGPDLTIDALPADGSIFVGGPLDAGATAALDRAVGDLVTPIAGYWAWHARPPHTESIQPFAPPQPDRLLGARIKQALDPLGLFNPGRYLPILEAAAP